jgi:PEGA domain
MMPADDVSERETARPVTSVLGSTSLVLAAIVLMTAIGSFGVVRAWFSKGRTAPATPATIQSTIAADAGVPQAADARREIDTPTTAGRLSIVTDPAGARVAVDGRPRGVSPVVIDGLAAAEHHITVVSDSGVAERTIVVSNGVMTEVVFSLPRTTAPIAGWLTIKSAFPVEMLEHDEVVGASGAAKVMLAAGTHQLLLRNEALGFEATRTIGIVAGKVTAVDINPPKALVNVNARPWADVSIDGEMVGQTPLGSLSLAVGPHDVVFRHPQFGERTERIVVTARGLNRVAVDFTK